MRTPPSLGFDKPEPCVYTEGEVTGEACGSFLHPSSTHPAPRTSFPWPRASLRPRREEARLWLPGQPEGTCGGKNGAALSPAAIGGVSCRLSGWGWKLIPCPGPSRCARLLPLRNKGPGRAGYAVRCSDLSRLLHTHLSSPLPPCSGLPHPHPRPNMAGGSSRRGLTEQTPRLPASHLQVRKLRPRSTALTEAQLPHPSAEQAQTGVGTEGAEQPRLRLPAGGSRGGRLRIPSARSPQASFQSGDPGARGSFSLLGGWLSVVKSPASREGLVCVPLCMQVPTAWWLWRLPEATQAHGQTLWPSVPLCPGVSTPLSGSLLAASLCGLLALPQPPLLLPSQGLCPHPSFHWPELRATFRAAAEQGGGEGLAYGNSLQVEAQH